MFHILNAQLQAIARLAAEEHASRVIIDQYVAGDGARFVDILRGNGSSRHVKINLKGEIA